MNHVNLDEILTDVSFTLNPDSPLRFDVEGATPQQLAYIESYKISILTALEGHIAEYYALQCPYCQEIPFWDGKARYDGHMPLVCPRCANLDTLHPNAINTFWLTGEFYRPTLADYNERFNV